MTHKIDRVRVRERVRERERELYLSPSSEADWRKPEDDGAEVGQYIVKSYP